MHICSLSTRINISFINIRVKGINVFNVTSLIVFTTSDLMTLANSILY